MSIRGVRILTNQYLTVSMPTEVLSFTCFKFLFFSISTSSKVYVTREISFDLSGFIVKSYNNAILGNIGGGGVDLPTPLLLHVKYHVYLIKISWKPFAQRHQNSMSFNLVPHISLKFGGFICFYSSFVIIISKKNHFSKLQNRE